MLNKLCHRFKGDYVDGVKQGFGQFWWTSGRHAGDKYVGQFQADKRHGYGQGGICYIRKILGLFGSPSSTLNINMQ